MQIFISCGHNNARNIRNIISRDQGAVSGGFTEYGIIKEITRLMPARYKGNDTLVFVPEKLSLVDRVSWINKKSIDGDIAIELHMNSGGGTGTETFYWDGSKAMQNMAWTVSHKLGTKLNIKDRGPKPDTSSRFGRLGFIRDTKPSALLIELGFIDSKFDRDQVISYGATAICETLKEIYG